MLKKVVIPALILIIAFVAFKVMNADRTADRPGSGQTQAAASAQKASGDSEEKSDENSEESKEEEEKPQSRSRGPIGTGVLAKQGSTSVEVIAAKAIPRMGEITLYGLVEARQQATITATTTAEVVSLNAEEGELVSAGQSILTLSADSAKETLAQRKAALVELDARIRNEELKHQNDVAALKIDRELLTISKNSVDRFSSLHSQQLSSNSDYEEALRTYQSQLLTVQSRELTIAQHEDTSRQYAAQRESLLSQIRQAEETVEDLSVKAPFTGLLAKIEVAQGQELRSGESIAEIYDPKKLVLYVRVPLRYRLDLVDLKQITATDSSGQAWQVLAIRPVNESGAQRLTLTPANNASTTKLPGTHVAVNVQYPIAQPTIEVPFTAVYDQQRVYVAEQGKLNATDINILGNTRNGYLISAENIADNAQIVTTRLKNPLTGMPVSVADNNGGGQS
jgi:biotin carboxyl carrier protein